MESASERYRIILDAAASECERFAADELKKHLSQMAVDVEIAAGPVACSGLCVLLLGRGDVEQSFSVAQYKDVLADDGFFIKAHNDALMIGGPRPRAVLFGVYGFLELLGCRWYEPGTGGEVVPAIENLDLSGFDIVENPAFPLRTQLHCVTKDQIDFLAKQRMNHFLIYSRTLLDFERDILPELVKRDLDIEFGHHDFHYFIPPDRYGSTHPEYFALYEGKRRTSKIKSISDSAQSGQLCLSNEGLTDEFARNVIAFFDRYPQVGAVSIWYEDGPCRWCECEKCGMSNVRGPEDCNVPKTSGYYLDFVNKIARRVRSARPGKRVTYLGYGCTYLPPASGRAEESVDICIGFLGVHGSKNVDRFKELVVLWKGFVGERQDRNKLFVYEYFGYNSRGCASLPSSRISHRLKSAELTCFE